ncbi:Brain-specific angiogenesis inhibitor 3 [Pitangus sulphuratus]|nr:Brain-specific angiogenesis inhibitor 3 [Pitangus sulphuratus]
MDKKLGGDTAGTADPKWPKGYPVLYDNMLSNTTGDSLLKKVAVAWRLAGKQSAGGRWIASISGCNINRLYQDKRIWNSPLVNMVIGILVFNKLVSRDGILDKKLKHRAGASLWSSCVVLPLLALTWMSAVLAMTDKRSILFQILFAVFDSLQGFVIVMVHCILRRETDFEKDVDIACRSVLHKDIGPCRAATITGTLSRISLNDEEEEKGPNPEGMSYSTLPGNIISKVIIQQPTGLHMPMSMSELANQCLKKDNSELRRTVYLCTDDNLRGADMDIVHPQERMIESDYIVMPRGSVNTQPSLKDESKMNIGMDTLPHERLLHYKVNPEFNMNPSVMDQFNINLDQHLPTQEHMQNLPFEPRTAVKNFIASELDDNAGLSRSETGSTISMSSLEVSGA